MNLNQKIQVEKVLRLIEINDELEKKKIVLSQTQTLNLKKMGKILTFLRKQGLSAEEIYSLDSRLVEFIKTNQQKLFNQES